VVASGIQERHLCSWSPGALLVQGYVSAASGGCRLGLGIESRARVGSSSRLSPE
jgi:hypothetical protein